MTEIRTEPATADALGAYGAVPIAFVVGSRLRVEAVKGDAFRLTEEPVAPTWIKDYDAVKSEGPTRWAARWDLANWVVLGAWRAGRRVGGAVVARDTEGVDMLEDRRDLAVLQDLRVDPTARRSGAGRALVDAAIRWAAEQGCHELKVETQDVNVPACRFYAACGFTLAQVTPNAYGEPCRDETMLIWRRPV